MYDDNFFTLGFDRYGITLSTEPVYFSITWGFIALVVVVIVGLKTLRRRKRNK
jgi:hypothetical protein